MIKRVLHTSSSFIDNRDSKFFVINWSEEDFYSIFSAAQDIFSQYGDDFMEITTSVPLSELAYYIRHHPNIEASNIPLQTSEIKLLLNTTGIVVLSRIPEKILSDEKDLYHLYFGIQCLIGTPCYGNVDLKTIYPIITKQVSEKKIIKEGNIRVTNTITPLPFHTDVATYNALLCVNSGKCGGGENELVSTVEVHNYILDRRPELLAELYKPCYIDRRGEELPGHRKYTAIPVFKQHNNLLMTFYTELYNKTAIDKYDLNETDLHREALEFLDSSMIEVSKMKKIFYKAENGNIIILHNHLTFHNRLTFQSEERKLLRCWIFSLDYPTFPHLWGLSYE